MKNFSILFRLYFILFFCVPSYAQEIDSSLLGKLTPAQIQMAQDRLANNNIINKPKPTITESTIKVSETIDVNAPSEKKYGYSYFSSVPTSITAVGDLPLPNEYKISLNDQFTVILSGAKEIIYDLNVSLDGSILVPELGSISVVGETFKEVKAKLRNLINQSYIGVDIDLSLKNLSAKKITIVGAVNTPGTYLVNPFSTISSALGYSGGVSEIGTLRNIRLVRNNGDTYSFDLYKLLINGDRSDDVTIESGDVIVIDPAEQFIILSGQIKRPAIYEIKKDETLDDLIKFGLGYTQIANKTNINISFLDNQSSVIKNLNVSDTSINLDNVLSVNVNPYLNKSISSVSVAGAISEPGFYDIGDNETLKNLINKLEFIDVYPWLAVLEQFDDNNLVKYSTLFSLSDPSTYESITLLPNSKVYFANINSREFDVDKMTLDLIDEFKLTINHKQGSFVLPVIGNYSVKSFIDLLGLDMSDVEDNATYISPLESKVIKDDYRNMNYSAKKYNTVSFRSPVNDLIKVSINGSVDFPGTYTLQSNSTLQDLYDLVGRFKEEAFKQGIIFTRESVRQRQLDSIARSQDDLNKALLISSQSGDKIGDINIIKALSQTIDSKNLGRIAGDFSPNSLSSKNTILVDGDAIIVPKNPNAINVLGEVINPTAFEYSRNLNVKSAIAMAGGFQDYANKKKVYVIKANGLIEKANRNIFVRNIKIEPGDTIIVPRKIIVNEAGIKALVPLTNILSDLAFSAAALESLSNNN